MQGRWTATSMSSGLFQRAGLGHDLECDFFADGLNEAGANAGLLASSGPAMVLT
jgi:hypothetical protein